MQALIVRQNVGAAGLRAAGRSSSVREARLPLVVRAQEQQQENAPPQQQSPQAAAPAPEQKKKPSPLEKGGTKAGAAAAGKDANPLAKAKMQGVPVEQKTVMQIVDGRFKDDRWIDGRWDLSQFAGADGNTDWDKVIDAEIGRRKLLESNPIACMNEDPAEKLNGRAAMVGYFLAIFVDKWTGHGLLEQQNSFLGLLALHITVFGILAIRQNSDLDNLRNLFDEATFYDRQWNATWDNVKRPSESQE
ncbi:hypothetical protein DUNSADRAFT_832 [Dunaliella salina]|uniref:Uncharacterized protein n=1 Tax=Dunaliella salina TaxID=3046 RepID=A0ABQ7GXV0_DUNSA|nr:hypothetical protein DUNSADRAFT_832 [Dunaliella salina]|eukprot:KAF5839430.1 hypothetical protein DUNSADRAFT_832 [Dunaliella salina]